MRTLLFSSLALVLACGGDGAALAPDAGQPPRSVEATLALSESGVSEPLSFAVPEGTRSVAIVVEGRTDALYALASLQLGGRELVGLDATTAPGPAMRISYEDEEVGRMEGSLYQSIRLGTFTHIYPYAPDQSATAGAAQLRVASTATSGTVSVTILMARDDGARRLPIRIVDVSEGFAIERSANVAAVAAGVFSQVDIELVLETSVVLDRPDLMFITDFSEPQEAPGSQSSSLALAAWQSFPGDALNVFIVDGLPPGVAGLSLGTPGPPLADSYYFGVVLRSSGSDAELGRVLAHEVAHFLALQHVLNTGLSGGSYPDPIDDTAPGQGNLMEGGQRRLRARRSR